MKRTGGVAVVKGVKSGGETEVSPEARRIAARRLIETHDAVFRRTARRYSICADDAEDAYQRALEILLTKAPPIGGDNLVRWMQTVTKREALGVRYTRERLLSAPRPPAGEEDRDPLDAVAAEGPGPDERAASAERVARSGEALRALKPQEVRALMLKAEGYSYTEIGEITGWSHTKINRCMAEGRKRFLEVFDELEAGDRCGEMASALSAIADGESPAGGADDVHLHLRSCGACRAKLRAFRAVPDRVLELLPFGAVDASTKGQASAWIGERVAAATEKVKELGYSVTTRGTSDGTVSGIAGSGGTRGAGMAAIGKALAICGATAAGGAACVAGGVVAPPIVGGGAEEKPAIEAEQVPAAEPIDQGEVVAPAPVAAEPAAEQQAAAAAEPAPAPTPVEQKQQQFSIEPAPAPAPASAPPSSGGGEFGGASSGGSGGSGGGGSGGGGGFGIE